jgi:hypothetical protein
MEKIQKETEIGYETDDFIPGTDVLAVESKVTEQDVLSAAQPPPAAAVPPIVPGRTTLAEDDRSPKRRRRPTRRQPAR